MEYKLLFINCYPRSGSTILGKLLGSHSSITYLGEVRNIHEHLVKNKPDYNGDFLSNCPFWKSVFENLGDNPIDLPTKISYDDLRLFSLNGIANQIMSPSIDAFIGSLSKKFKEEKFARENIRKYYRATSKVIGSNWILDSSHHTVEVNDHFHLGDQELRVIFLARDGRGVVNSMLKKSNLSIKQATKKWARFNERAMSFHSKLSPNHLHKIKYEDLCKDPQLEVNKICNFLGLEEYNLEQNFTLTEFHFIGGSPTVKSNARFDIRLDESWKDVLSKPDLKIFDKYSRGLNQRLGYEM